jgi:hypothetical protein
MSVYFVLERKVGVRVNDRKQIDPGLGHKFPAKGSPICSSTTVLLTAFGLELNLVLVETIRASSLGRKLSEVRARGGVYRYKTGS